MKHILSASVVGLCMLPLDASAITVAVDYSDSTTSFFDDSPNGILAQKAVEAAAADISAAITTQLAPLDDDSFNSGGFTVIARLNYKNPDSGSSTNFSGDLAQDEFRLYVGARAIVDDETLGQGGPGGTVFGGSSAGNQAAANIAASAASTEMMRGSGVLISSRSASPSEETFTYSSDFGPAIGNLWFDNDASTSWHLDHTMAVASGKSDLYSVALHEILHSLGYGVSDAWDANVSGRSWTGAAAIAANGGSGVGLIAEGGGHATEGTMSKRISDGVSQEAVMDPSITTGTRKELTELDLAFLQDLGYTTIPEPSSISLLGLSVLALLARRKRA